MKECKCNGEAARSPQLEEILSKYADMPGGLITILQKTQDVFGYLPEDAIERIAERTGISTAKIYGVETFYTQFRLKPIGKYLIMPCMGTACHVNGAAQIVEAISERLGIADGETTTDRLFTLNVVACLGCCSLAPVMAVRGPSGDETYGTLTKASVVKIIDELAACEAASVKNDTGKEVRV